MRDNFCLWNHRIGNGRRTIFNNHPADRRTNTLKHAQMYTHGQQHMAISHKTLIKSTPQGRYMQDLDLMAKVTGSCTFFQAHISKNGKKLQTEGGEEWKEEEFFSG